MGEETDKCTTLEIGADTDNSKNGLPNDQKRKSKKQTKNQVIISEDDSDGSYGPNANRSENDSDNDENVSSNPISSKDREQTKTNGETQHKEFCVKSTNKDFKLRLVPLERLLCSSKKAELEKEKATSLKAIKVENAVTQASTVVRKLLPQRSNRKNYSVIEISSSSSSSDVEEEKIVAPKKKDNTVKSVTKASIAVKRPEQSEKRRNTLVGEANKKSKSFVSEPRCKRCVVRLKRVPWPVQQNKLNRQESDIRKTSLEPNKPTEKPTTSKSTTSANILKRLISDSSSASTSTSEKVSQKTRLEVNKSEEKPTTSKSTTSANILRRLISDSSSSSSSTSKKVSQKTHTEVNKSEERPTTSKSITDTNRKKRLVSESSSTSTSHSTSVCRMEKPSDTKKRKVDSSDSDSDFDLANATQKSSDAEPEQQAESTDEENSNSTDSEVLPTRKKRVFNKKQNSSDDSDFEPKGKPPKAKKPRRRIKNDSDDSDDDSDKEKNKHKRKDIRKIIKSKDLDVSTKEAAKEEDERRKRIEERQKLYNQIYERPETQEITELVLDFDEESKEALLQVDRGLLKKLKPHQVAGVKFMWDACFETLVDTIEKPGSGCILAHCMGLGKTLQVVTLTHTLLSNSRKTHVERVLIISPLSTLNNWAREFKQWMSFARKKNIEIYDMSRYKDKNTRIFKLKEWFEEGGVCIIGYDLYRILSNEKAKGLRKKQREDLQQALIEPGPDLVICDEGHLLKNEKTSISKAVTRMRTKRRIVLTGTPLQNNLKEYYCMIQFIKPNLLGTYKEYLNRFVNPITNGQYTDSTERDIRLMRHRSHILHKLLEGCIQRRDYSVLAPYLPPKHEYVVYTNLSELQQKLYDFYMTVHRDVNSSDICGKGARLFQDFQDLRRIWTHPMSLRVNSDIVIRKRLLADDENSMEDFICDDDEEEATGAVNDDSTSDDSSVDSTKSFASGGGNAASGSVKIHKTRHNKQLNDGNDSDQSATKEVQKLQQDDPSEWWKRFVDEAALSNLHHSPKLVILMRLLQQCEAIGDKLLVFSQSLQSLDVIEHFLSLIDQKTSGNEIEGDIGDIKGRWKYGVDYFRLDGSCSVENREDMCKRFNNVDNLRARLFLISTRAGGLGINLVAANRVVIFDVSWNPSHDTQSIFRVYRFGQDKPCYIYRLIAMGTMEQKVYERQVTKQATAKRVIDEQQISRHYNQSDLQELYTYELKPTMPREIPILPKDRLFAELLTDYENLIFKYHEHDSLLENEDSETLNEEDRKAAWSEYEAEKTRATQTAQYISYDRTAYANPMGSVTSSRIFGFRSDVLLQLLSLKVAKDNPEFNQNQITQLVPAYLDRLYKEMHNNDPSMYRELLDLNSALIQPGGMYMNPLLYANQNPQAAGYYQAPYIQQQQPQLVRAAPLVPAAPGFNSDEVYEID